MNILISSAGRRNELINYFRDAGACKVVLCDMNPYAVCFQTADKGYQAPPINAPSYQQFILDVCSSENIDLVLTLNDMELPLLAEMKDQLSELGIQLLVSDSKVINVCWDKKLTNEFLTHEGFATPTHYDIEDMMTNIVDYPLIVKPRFGTGSLSIEVVEYPEEFQVVYQYIDRKLRKSSISQVAADQMLLIQEKIVGTEYAVDVVNDLEGQYHGCVIKRKITTRGDADCVVTVKDAEIADWCQKLSAALGHIGNADLDLIVNEFGIYCVDINPRFGGAYPFSHLAGVNVPAMILAWLDGRQAEAVCYHEGIISARTESYLKLDKVEELMCSGSHFS